MQNTIGAGVQTAALFAGGYIPGSATYYRTTETESWNGTSWTEVNDLNTARNLWLNKELKQQDLLLVEQLEVYQAYTNNGMEHLGQKLTDLNTARAYLLEVASHKF